MASKTYLLLLKFQKIDFDIRKAIKGGGETVYEANVSTISNSFIKSAVSYSVLPKDLESSKNFGANGDSSWLMLYTILYLYDPEGGFNDDCVIGMTSPYTIVVPSKDFRSIINSENIFNFLEYDNKFIKAVADDDKKFGDNCNYLLARQFDKFSAESLKSLREWLVKIKPFCPHESVCRQSVDDFIKTVEYKIGTGLTKEKWVFADSHFSTNAFYSKDMAAFQPVNISTKQVALDREWYALFSILALRNLKKLQLQVREKGTVITLNGADILKGSEHSIFVPLSNIKHNADISWIKENGTNYDFELTSFECRCILQWLSRTINDKKFNKIGNLDNKEAVTFAEKFEEIIKDKLYSEYSQTGQEDWADNRFLHDEIAGLSKDFHMLQLTIHPYNAPFFEDTEGAYQEDILRNWFNVLESIAFSEMHNINILSTQEKQSDAQFNNYDMASDLYRHNINTRYSLKFTGDKKPFAVTSRSTILSVLEPQNVQTAVLDKLLIPNERDLLPGRVNISTNVSSQQNLLVFDHALYDYEITLLKKWFDQLIIRLKSDKVLLNQSNDDMLTIVNHINNKIDSLTVSTIAGIDLTDNDYSVLSSYYSYKDITSSADSTLSILNFCIEDNMFAKQLLYTDQSGATIACDILNTDSKESIYAIHNKQGHTYSPASQQGSKQNYNGIIVLPITNGASNSLYNIAQDPKKKHINDVSRFGLKYIKTYKDTFGEDSDNLEVAIQLENVSIPLIKVYTEPTMLSSDNVVTMLPGVVVWPDVEIEKWSSYFLSIDRKDPNNISLPIVSLPNFIEYETKTENSVSDFPFGDSTWDVSFDSYRCKSYPIMLSVDFNANGSKSSGLLLTRPRDTQYVKKTGIAVSEKDNIDVEDKQKRGQFIKNDIPGIAIIGIDFGTTNTTSYMKFDDVDYEIDFRLASSNYITHSSFTSGNDSRVYDSLVAQQPTYDPQNRETSVNILGSTLMKFLNDTTLPLVHSNVYRLLGHELSSNNSLLNRQDGLFKHSMKWANVTPKDVKSFLLQIAMMCCVVAVKKHRVSNVELRVSYPISLPEMNKTLLKDMWNEVVGIGAVAGENLTNITGISVTVHKDKTTGQSKYFYTESYASGNACVCCNELYEEDGKWVAAKPEDGFVCVDIGGGSTDISVFYTDSYPKATISVPFAGQLLLSSSGVIRYRESTKKFLLEILSDLNKKINKLNDNQKEEILVASLRLIANNKLLATGSRIDTVSTDSEFAFLVDVIVGNFAYIYDAIQKVKNEKSNFSGFLAGFARTSDGRAFLARIKFGMSAIAYFIGTLIKKLMDDGNFDLQYSKTFNAYTLKLFFAGTGSKILDWFIAIDEEGINSFDAGIQRTMYILAKYIHEGLAFGKEKQLKIEIHRTVPDKVKQEVVMGLVNADANYAAMDAQGMDSLVKIDIESLFFSAQKNPNFDFKRAVRGRLEKTGYQNDEINILLAGTRDEVFKRVTEKINPDFADEEALRTQYFQIIGGFMRTFCNVSPNDYNILFKNIPINLNEELTVESNSDLIHHLEPQFPLLIAPVNLVNKDELPMPIREFLPYIILKYASLILKGRYA